MKPGGPLETNIPVFIVFICGAIGELIMSTDISFFIQLILWCLMYTLALYLHERFYHNKQKKLV